MNKELSANTTLSHYRIVSKIGEGGMGEVYLAEDTRLERRVAVKLLGEELNGNEDRLRRFVREAKAASALNHPNILTVYDIGETDSGTNYIATEYIEGETLRHHIQSSRMKVREVLDAMVQVASALATAHQAGILHRDIKPENLMLRPDGIMKVLDFGLAKLTEKSSQTTDSAAATLSKKDTTPGTIMGTVQYMSPEQARGLSVDARTDIFSLGIVLYEMLAGRVPFAGESSTDVLSAILDKEPLPLLRFVDEMPTELQRIVSKCLRKERDERYQTMKDVLLDLRELRDDLALEAKLERSIRPVGNQRTMIAQGEITAEGAIQTRPAPTTSSAEYLVNEIRQHKRRFAMVVLGLLIAASGLSFWYLGNRAASPKQIESIAVMPFVNESGNQDVEYLSDGMTETLIGSLSQLPNLNVKARSSVFRYKGKELDVGKIAQELKVQAILMGRVVQRGEQLTLSLELVDTQTENVIWSEQYNRKQADLVTLQSEIARDVSNKLKTKLTGADERKLAKRYTENAEAYQLYLKGRFYWNKREEKDFQKAIGYFNQAIALDPNYALAYAGLADSHALLSTFGYAPPADGMTKAREFALKALSIDGSLAEPHTTLGVILLSYDYDFAGAEREYKRAIELNPNYATAHQWYGEMLTCDGRFEEAFAEYRRGLDIDPLSLPVNWEYGRSFYHARKFDEAIAQHKKTLELDAGFSLAHRTLSEVYRVRGDHVNAIEELVRNFELSGEPQNAALIRETFAKGGWSAYLRLVTAENSSLKYRHFIVAKAYVELGEKDKAFAELYKAYENRESPLQWLKVEPQLDPLRPDARFQELLKKIGLPQ